MAPRTKASTAAKPARPTYSVMVTEAIRTLKDRSGSSVPAITKQLVLAYKMEVNKLALRTALKKGVDSGELVKVKASYKIAKKEPAPKKTTTTTTTKKSTATSKTKKATTGPKKTITKKKAAAAKPKKTTTKKKASVTKAAPKKKTTPRKPPTARGTRTSGRTRK